ncbi:MAG: hypothetical protein WBA74_15890 [Cyclobacteriaceae bacterium]
MSYIGIEIPGLDQKQEVEVEVRINGEKQHYNYRVEIFYWEDCENAGADRVECIRTWVNRYDADWDLANIGMPNDQYIPITFRRKRN